MKISPAYQEALDFIYTYVDYSMSHRPDAKPYNLDRMRWLAGVLGNPQDDYPVIHIAGTKGKGSVAAMCAAALQSAGYRTGLYTSPHLEDFSERIQIDRHPIAQERVVALLNEIRPVIEGRQVTTFEITTALAFRYFSRQQVDIAVVEVGLGGRLDATNIVRPNLTVITSLSLDHTSLLGNTIESIAFEKAGIIKEGIPVVLAPQVEPARKVVVRTALERGAPIIQVGRDVHFELKERSLEGQVFRIWADKQPDSAIEVRIGLLGDHQIENAAVAYTALQQALQVGIPLTQANILEGLAHAQWPGRLELLQRSPFLLLDAAHNLDSARRLRQALDDYFPGQPVTLLYGASEDKDVGGMLDELKTRIARLIATQSTHPRALPAGEIAARAKEHGIPAESIPAIEAALEAALHQAEKNEVILVTGSIFVVAAVRQVYRAGPAALHPGW